jgi:hypothetical protein
MEILEMLMRALPVAKPFMFAIIIAAFNYLFFAWLDKHARYRLSERSRRGCSEITGVGPKRL